MMRHVSANLWLLVLTLLLCSVAYPLVLLAVAQLPFLKEKADGSLLTDKEGKIIGSKLEAQAFAGDEYFWPRPSAVSYKGEASGASNWSANNPALRRRVQNQLGALLKYGPKSGKKKGQMIRDDIEDWFGTEKQWLWNKDWAAKNPELAKKWEKGLLGSWAESNPELAKAWTNDAELNKQAIDMWKTTSEGKAWLRFKKAIDTLKAEDLAVDFFQFYSLAYPGNWPQFKLVPKIHPETKAEFKALEFVRPHSACKEVRTYFYPMWREAHPDVDLDPVPADMVTTSGSGLDPHITLKSALYQFDRVADKWTELRKPMARDEVAGRLHKLLEAHKHAPLGGLAGVDLVNVLELNAALKNGDW